MKGLTCLMVFCCSASFAQIEVRDLVNLSSVEKENIVKHLTTHDEVVLTSPTTDSALFQVINKYRISKNLNKLKHSIRLDTLANIVIRRELKYDPIHYNQYPESKPYRDLMSLENLQFGGAFGKSIGFNKFIENLKPEDILQGWIDSPSGHNRNLLAEAEVGTAMVLLVIRKNGEYYDITYRAIYEADYSLSKRELDENIKKKNAEIRQRKIVIKRS